MKRNYVVARSIEELDEVTKALKDSNDGGLAVMTTSMWEEHMHNDRDYKMIAHTSPYRTEDK